MWDAELLMGFYEFVRKPRDSTPHAGVISKQLSCLEEDERGDILNNFLVQGIDVECVPSLEC